MGALWRFSFLASFLVLLPSSSAQPGFISIDCGTSGSYIDESTNITWTGDEGFIQTGSNTANLPTGMQLALNKRQMSSLRFFNDERTKHCYVLPISAPGIYLVRAMFLYTNYDKKSANPRFDLAIDATYWTTVDLTVERDVENSWFKPTVAEVLVPVETPGSISVCLLRTSASYAPFISSLELRLMANGSYSYVQKRHSLLHTVSRYSFGPSKNRSNVRFPDDPFDRLWSPSGQVPGVSTMSTRRSIVSTLQNIPPSIVLQSGWIADSSFTFSWDSLPPAGLYYAVFYFSELNGTDSTDQRVIDILLNDLVWWKAVNLTASFPLSTAAEVQTTSVANFSFVKAPESTLGPLLNAAELFAVLAVTNQTSYPADVEILNSLRVQFSLESWTGDPCSPVPWNWISCSSDLPRRVTAIKLSGSNLAGHLPVEILQLDCLVDLFLDDNRFTSIPEDFTSLLKLERLYLQNNVIRGSVPQSLEELPRLKELFLENNHFNGTLPEQLMNTSTFLIKVYGNPFLCVPYQYVCGAESTNSTIIIIVCSTGALVSVILMALLICCCRRQRIKMAPVRPRNQFGSPYYDGNSFEVYTDGQAKSGMSGGGPFTPRIEVPKYSYEQMRTATEDFKVQTEEGVLGPVYYGKLPDAKEIAVATLSPNSTLSYVEFITEVAIISKVQHKNLVSLLGYCDEPRHRILVYEHMASGTLRDHLYGKLMQSEPLEWKQRLEIALNVAKGLQFLHTQCAPGIVHGDVNSSNVHLTKDLVAKVAEFGSAKLREGPNANCGNMVSEFTSGEKLTPKSDVFNFGVLLLECMCGSRTPKAGAAAENVNIIQWVKTSLQAGDIHAIVDSALGKRYNVEAMWHVAELALLSTESRALSRPTMTQVVRGLVEAVEIESAPSFASPSINLRDKDEKHRDKRSASRKI